MTTELDRLAEAHGIALSYITETGEERFPSEESKRRMLAAFGVPAGTDEEVRRSLAALEPRCHLPGWLNGQGAWGLTCQLYSLRSDRNWGIGDFEDLARLAELAAGTGADFIGVNPLHALFSAEPARFSPYSPSSRRFLNPLYIAVDRFETIHAPDEAALAAVRAAELVDYPAVADLKRRAFEAEFAHFQAHDLGSGSARECAFLAFRRQRGAMLDDFALFEALSEHFARQGQHCGWHCWPEAFRDKNNKAVRTFAKGHPDRVLFHAWLQWMAQEQLAMAQSRAKAAGMRIGLYLDLAVGVAPDGADTWCQPDVVLRGVRVGAPPDAFNANGQDWGLAPISPRALASDGARVFGQIIADATAAAGAVRIDHVMALTRLYLIAEGVPSADGAYVAFPFRQMLGAVSQASQQHGAIIIGEDLGTVPPGFRETLQETAILGYRVLFFEREGDGRFRQPQHYHREAMACISTHDLPTLSGWWAGTDIDDREALGLDEAASAAAQRLQRSADRQLMMAALIEAGLISEVPEDTAELSQEIAVAISRFLARTPCRLVALQLEDLAGMRDRANLPGTIDEHPNWRRRLAAPLEALIASEGFQVITRAVAAERSRTGDGV
jgi:4-alpha-glucanotransferase